MELDLAERAKRRPFARSSAVIALVGIALLAPGPAQAGSEQAAGKAGATRAAAGLVATSPDRLVEPRDRLKDPPRHRVAKRSIGALGEVRNAAGEPLALTDDACERNVALAASRDLRLPDGWAIHCLGPGLDWEGGSHWGVTCPYDECPEGAGPYISISNPTYYVVAHELCHANFGNDELIADACAADHGASLAASPYN